MHRGIATVSLSGRLVEKLQAASAAGFDGVEIFDNDLVACPLSPGEVAALCAELGLSIDLFQPVRDVAGVREDLFAEALRRFEAKLAVMDELGTPVVLVCSHVGEGAVDDLDLTAGQLRRLGDAAAPHGVTIAFEALAWGRHVNRLAQAWEAVRRADHPAVTVAVDTFHMLARGDGGEALAGVPGERIGFLQVADAPVMDMDVLEWSRHFRCFPGQGMLDVTGVVAATLEAGYAGPLSLEVFSDVVREADPRVTARDAYRSLVFLEDQVANVVRRGTVASVTSVAPAAARTDSAFVEIADPGHASGLEALLEGLGFVAAGRHRTKPVTWWRNGGAHVVLNAAPRSERAHAVGVLTPDVAAVAARAAALDWPAVDRTRGDGEALLPGITSPSGLHVLVSSPADGTDHWQGDFVPYDGAGDGGGWTGVDHVGVAVPADRLNEEVAFFRTLFDLVPSPVEEFMEPHGRLLSRALRPRVGDVRMVVNVEDLGPRRESRSGVTQVAFACDDVLGRVRELRRRGVPLMEVPDNYYVDLAARFPLAPDRVAELREHQVLYDRSGAGELLHVYTPTLASGFCVELLERRGEYDGYGSANTHVRLASSSRGGVGRTVGAGV
jgi:4-hydroxyphenylpyruvate dioxygenase